jgi:hypothetical protein
MKRITAALILPLLLGATSALAAPKTVAFESKGKGYDFGFSYPAIVTTFPKLKAQIEKQRADALSEIKADNAQWIKDQPKGAFDVTLDRQINWAQMTNLPAYLSLTIDDYRYDGGAHGNFDRGSIIWDKAAEKQINPIDMFTSKAAFDKLIQTRYCDLLDIERSKKRDGEKVDRSQTNDWMQACPKPSELVVFLGSSDSKKFDRMAIYAAPYAVGPYVEGDYEINLPMTAALVAIVKPQYRAAFAANAK